MALSDDIDDYLFAEFVKLATATRERFYDAILEGDPSWKPTKPFGEAENLGEPWFKQVYRAYGEHLVAIRGAIESAGRPSLQEQLANISVLATEPTVQEVQQHLAHEADKDKES